MYKPVDLLFIELSPCFIFILCGVGIETWDNMFPVCTFATIKQNICHYWKVFCGGGASIYTYVCMYVCMYVCIYIYMVHISIGSFPSNRHLMGACPITKRTHKNRASCFSFINQTPKFINFSDRTTGGGQLLLFFEGGGGGVNYACSLRGGRGEVHEECWRMMAGWKECTPPPHPPPPSL